MTVQLNGIYTPVITPFNDDLSVDYGALADVIDWQIEHGVAGIIVGGSTGEFFSLNPTERISQLEFAAQHIAGRVSFIAGVNDLTAGNCVRFSIAAKDCGADALLVAAPPYVQPAPNELAEHVRAIDRSAGLP
ncbi:MAG: dihydrodipicolinate synthase family protein, partial [Woeseia sp.]